MEKVTELTHLVVGLGEVGQAIFEVLSEKLGDKVTGYDWGEDEDDKPRKELGEFDVLHVCIPYSKAFEEYVQGYIEEVSPGLVIVYSSTPIGKCNSIGTDVVHSPVEGRHPELANSIRRMTRWLGCQQSRELLLAANLWSKVLPGNSIKVIADSARTEFLKLYSTSKYGVNLAFADYANKVGESVEVSDEDLKEFDKDYNDLYQRLGMTQFQRYILDDPKGEIGGHCVVPNAKLLNEFASSPLLESIIKMEKK